MSDLPTAEEARKQAESVEQGANNAQLTSIATEIRKAIKEGKTKCFFYHPIRPAVKKYLSSQGYRVGDNQDCRNETVIPIEW